MGAAPRQNGPAPQPTVVDAVDAILFAIQAHQLGGVAAVEGRPRARALTTLGELPRGVRPAIHAAVTAQLVEGEGWDRADAEAAWRNIVPHVEDPAGSTGNPDAEPLFDIPAIRFGRFLESDPPVRRMLLAETLQLEIAGLLAAMGGAGKSVFLYQLGVCVAAGVPFLGLEVEHVGGVLCVFAEDDDAELHRRGRRLLAHIESLGRPIDRAALGERLHVVSRVAADNLLTRAGADGEVRRTALVEQLIAASRQIPDLRLIVLDPVSRFRGGRANHEEDATRFVECLEALREATGAAVLAAAHVTKASTKDGDPDQGMVRGSSALVDGCRWVATLQRLHRADAVDYGLEEDDARNYLRLEVPKSNYTRPFAGLWLRREPGGVLVPAHLERQVDARKEAKADARYADTLERLQKLLLELGPMTRNRIEQKYAGTAGRLGAGLQTVRSVIERAVSEGGLIAVADPDGRGGRLLRPGGGK